MGTYGELETQVQKLYLKSDLSVQDRRSGMTAANCAADANAVIIVRVGHSTGLAQPSSLRESLQFVASLAAFTFPVHAALHHTGQDLEANLGSSECSRLCAAVVGR